MPPNPVCPIESEKLDFSSLIFHLVTYSLEETSPAEKKITFELLIHLFVARLPVVHKAPQPFQRTVLLKMADEGEPSSLGDVAVLWKAGGSRKRIRRKEVI